MVVTRIWRLTAAVVVLVGVTVGVLVLFVLGDDEPAGPSKTERCRELAGEADDVLDEAAAQESQTPEMLDEAGARVSAIQRQMADLGCPGL